MNNKLPKLRSSERQYRPALFKSAAVLLLTLLTACGTSTPASTESVKPTAAPTASAPTASSNPAAGNNNVDLDAARKEGPLVIWHGDQENDVVEFLKKFTEKTGIKTEQQRLNPGAALPKLESELKNGVTSADVWLMSDVGIMQDQVKKDRILQYVSPELKQYGAQYKSNPEGFYTTYFINVGPIMYNSKFVKKENAPKTWADLLDPKWKGQIGFQDASAGTSYMLWYMLKDILPKDYFDKLGQNQPRGYTSSTQIVAELLNGGLKIGGRVSLFQYVKGVRQGQTLEISIPPEGLPANLQVAGILKTTKRPNAAKAFMDFLLSKEGQELWNNIQGSYSALPDVKVKELPDITTFKLLTPQSLEDYGSASKHEEFVKLWNQITGLK